MKKPLRGEELSRLYFRQKTTEQRLEDDKRLAEIQLARRPRQPRLRVALYGSGLVGLIVLLASKVPALWETGSTPGISFTFLAWIVLGLARYSGSSMHPKFLCLRGTTWLVLGCIFYAESYAWCGMAQWASRTGGGYMARWAVCCAFCGGICESKVTIADTRGLD